MCGFLLPTQVKAFQTPSLPYGPSDQTFNYFGPAANTLLIHAYTSQLSTFSALQAGQIDLMDSLLTPAEYSVAAGNPAITTSAVAETKLVEYDLNNWCAPFNNTYYRQAFAYMINRTDYLNTYFPGGGTPCYDPLGFNPFGQAAEAYCQALYPPNDFAAAYSELVASGYPMFLENGTWGVPNYGSNTNPYGGGYFTWFFPSPFPTAPSSTPAGAIPSQYSAYSVPIPNATVQILARTEFPERMDLAAYLIALCGSTTSQFTTWAQTEYRDLGNAYFAALGMPLPMIKNVPQFPVINILQEDISSEVADVLVTTYYRYQMYTGAWIFDEFQDGLEVWLSTNTPPALGWAPFCLNIDDWVDPNYDTSAGMPYYDYYVSQSLTASSSGYGAPTNPAGSLYWAILAQEEMMSQVPMIPMFYYNGFSAVLTRDNYTVNELGTGFDNWFTFLDAQAPAGTLSWGWSEDLQNPNPISSIWAWDWYIMGPIYDSMLSVNPYTEAIIPALATNYALTINDPTNPFGPTCTSALMTLREDAFWQDLPAMDRAAYTLDGGIELNGPIKDQQVTPADVAFTFEYLTHDGQYQPVHLFSTVHDVGQVVISSIYKPLFAAYNTTYNNVWTGSAYINGVPGYAWENITYIDSPTVLNGQFAISDPFAPQNFIQFSNTMDPSQIEVYRTHTTGWFCEYAELSIPILPMHIFANLAMASWPNGAIYSGFTTPDEFTMVLDPAGANLLFGSGPFIWTGYVTGTYTLLGYKEGVSYEGVTENTGYWAMPVRQADPVLTTHPTITKSYTPGNVYCLVSDTLTNWDENETGSGTLSITLTAWWWNGYAWTPTTIGPVSAPFTIGKSGIMTLSLKFTLLPPLGSYWCILVAKISVSETAYVGVSGSNYSPTSPVTYSTIGSTIFTDAFRVLPGDITNAGSVSGTDLHIMGNHWLYSVPTGTEGDLTALVVLPALTSTYWESTGYNLLQRALHQETGHRSTKRVSE